MDRPRYALLASEGWLDSWHLRCLERLEEAATLAALIGPAGVARTPAPRSSPMVMRLYAWRSKRTSILEIARRLAHIPLFDTVSGEETIKSAKVDFILKLGRGPIPTTAARAARHGLWFFCHELTDDLPFFREVYEGEDVTAAALSRTYGGEATALIEGFFATEQRSYSANRDRVRASIIDWPARVCRQPHWSDVGGSAPAAIDAGPRARVGATSLLRFAARIARRRLAFAWKRLLRHDQWNIGILHAPAATLLPPAPYCDERIEWYPLPDRAAFLADPFGLVRDGTIHICCEYFEYRSGAGEMYCLQYANDGFCSPLERALALPFHLSYPFLIEDGEGIYCIPETSLANEVALFKAIEFPRRWSKAAVLVTDFAGVDPTVFSHEGRWWLTCTERGRDADVSLWIWHATHLTGPWMPHARNPVKIDVRGARPGGRPFLIDGQLYRPAQDCSKRYGWRIAIQRVKRLTPSEFEEELVTVLAPSAGSAFPLGRHTLTPVGDVVLIDGHRSIFVWAAFRSFVRIWVRDVVRSLTQSAKLLRSCRGRQT